MEFFKFILKEMLRNNFEIFSMIWLDDLVHFVITLGYFEAFVMPLRPHKTIDQYLLKSNIKFQMNILFKKHVGV